jgi:hypothetical protein
MTHSPMHEKQKSKNYALFAALLFLIFIFFMVSMIKLGS